MSSRNYEILNNNLSLNNINNVETLNYFISSQNEANVFFEKNVRDPYALIRGLKNNINLDNEIKNSSKFDGVKSIQISNLLKSLNFNPNLIFMDIEGIKLMQLKICLQIILMNINQLYFLKFIMIIIF